MRKIFLSPWLALITLFLLVTIRILDPAFVESVRLRYFDQLILSKPTEVYPVHVVNIDEDSLDKYGQWPFPRDLYSDIIKELYKRQAGLVVFNVLMPENDRFKQDHVLKKTLETHPVILPSLGHVKEKNQPKETNAVIIGQDPYGRTVEFPGLINSLPELTEIAAGVGIVNTFPEIDGVVRRKPLVILSQDRLHPTLALETLRAAVGDNNFQIKIGDHGVEALRLPTFGKIETDQLSRIWIDWSKQANHHSLTKLPKTFNNEIVIVGLSVAGLANPIATARGEVWPQEIQATMLSTILSGNYIKRTNNADIIEIISMLTLGLLVIFFGVWRRK